LSGAVEVVRTYLELKSPDQLRAAPTGDPRVSFVRRGTITVEEYRRLYRDVGASWHWHDRDAWDHARLNQHLAQANVGVWEALYDDESAGYFELERHPDDSIEIAYFGLTPRFIGRGIGKAMLTYAVRVAWLERPTRVWLHTCTLDSVRALPNYLARGFTAYKTEQYSVTLSG
jgi:GNAT superfamily N-acetyltransferase